MKKVDKNAVKARNWLDDVIALLYEILVHPTNGFLQMLESSISSSANAREKILYPLYHLVHSCHVFLYS